MTTARLRVTFAGPLVTLQDTGRFGHMRFGVPASGPMDRTAFMIARAALGTDAGRTGIEVSLGGVSLECLSGAVTIAVAGGGFSSSCGDQKLNLWNVVSLEPGQKFSLKGGTWGNWAYLAFMGEIQSNHWLGHSATHSLSGLGGGALKSGQVLEISDAITRENRHGPITVPAFAMPEKKARVVLGPQDQHFEDNSVSGFFENNYRISANSDRMGVRLEGPKLTLREALAIPSEPILRGSVQVSGDGVPTVLLADHQTTGGYPKIATVISCDTDRLSQMRPGTLLSFQSVSPNDSIAISRAFFAQRAAFVNEISKPRVTFHERLLRENLISGVISGEEE